MGLTWDTVWSELLTVSPRQSDIERVHAMLPPKYTKSVTVTAQDGKVILTARFGTNKEEEEEEERVEVNQGESHTFKERSQDHGTWQSVRKVVSVRAETEGGEVLFERACEEDCSGVHGEIHYTVHNQEKEFRVLARK